MKFILLRLIGFYQTVISRIVASPLLMGSFGGCRSWPTCSAFAIEAIERDGAYKGGVKAVIRVMKCNPLWPAQKYG